MNNGMTQFLPPEPQEDDKRLEALLTLGDQSFKTLCEMAPLGIYQTDAEGRCLYTNRQWQEIYGLSLRESLGDNWALTLYPGDKAAVFAAWQASVHGSRDFNMEFRILRCDGQIRYVRSQARAIRDVGGDIRGYVGAVQDVTERRVQADKLRASEAFLDRTGRIAGVGGLAGGFGVGRDFWVRSNLPHTRHAGGVSTHVARGHRVLRIACQGHAGSSSPARDRLRGALGSETALCFRPRACDVGSLIG
jgi:PAS domain S-box-containing protein